MAKAQALAGADLVPARRTTNGTGQRGAVPSAELVPLQFKMPAEFVVEFKVAAAQRRLKLNELLKECFDVFMKASKS